MRQPTVVKCLDIWRYLDVPRWQAAAKTAWELKGHFAEPVISGSSSSSSSSAHDEALLGRCTLTRRQRWPSTGDVIYDPRGLSSCKLGNGHQLLKTTLLSRNAIDLFPGNANIINLPSATVAYTGWALLVTTECIYKTFDNFGYIQSYKLQKTISNMMPILS